MSTTDVATMTTQEVANRFNELSQQGNWTQRTEYEKGKPTKIVKRTITYYKD